MSKIKQLPIFNLDWWGLGDSRRGFDWTVKDVTGVALLILALGGGAAQGAVHYGLFEARLPGLGLLGPLSVVLGVLALWRTADALRDKNRAWKIWAAVALTPIATSIWVTSTRQDLRAQSEADALRVSALERISSADERDRYRQTLIRELSDLTQQRRVARAVPNLETITAQIDAIRASEDFRAAQHCIGSPPRAYITFCADLSQLAAAELGALQIQQVRANINEIEQKLREAPPIIITSAERVQAGIEAERAGAELLARRNSEALARFWFSLLAYLIVDAAWIFIALRRSELAAEVGARDLVGQAAQARAELASRTEAATQAADSAFAAAGALAAAGAPPPPPSWRANSLWIEAPDGRRIARERLADSADDYRDFRRAITAGRVLPLILEPEQ